MATEDAEVKANPYSDGERDMMVFTQTLRGRLLGPLLRAMDSARIRANHLTFASLLMGLAFCPLYFLFRPAAFAALLAHVLLDGLDGPLARYTGTASPGGSFTDCMSDQAVITATTVTGMAAGVMGIVPGTLYVTTYALVVLFAMARNVLSRPYAWLVRPRFLVYAWLVVETYLLPGTTDYVLWLCVAFLVPKAVTGFVAIRGSSVLGTEEE